MTSIHEDLRKVDALIKAFNAGDIENYVEFRAESIVHYGPGLKDPLRGHDALHEFAHGFMDAFPDLRMQKVRVFGQGKWVSLEVIIQGTHRGPIEGPDGEVVSPTNRTVRYRDCLVMKFEGGKITEEREYYDQLDLLVQLGLAP